MWNKLNLSYYLLIGFLTNIADLFLRFIKQSITYKIVCGLCFHGWFINVFVSYLYLLKLVALKVLNFTLSFMKLCHVIYFNIIYFTYEYIIYNL